MRTLAFVFLSSLVALAGCNGTPPIPQDCRLLGCEDGYSCTQQEDGTYACEKIPCTPGSCTRDVDDPRMCQAGECVPCEPDLSDAIWNTDAGEVTCSTEERPVKHWPPAQECPVLTEACEEPPPPLPQPQCPTFTDRGGVLQPLRSAAGKEPCDCYIGEEWAGDCEEPPPVEPEPDCGFPQGAPNSDFTGTGNPGTYGSVVNVVMADLSGCAVGTDCPITFGPDPWMALVCEELCKRGLNCGRHDNEPPEATDQISVKRGSFCDGLLHENYQIYNYGGKKVRWAPGGAQDGWILDPESAVCTDGPVEPPPTGDCPAPHPDLTRMKFNTAEKGNHLDTTWTTNYQPDFCGTIGFCCMPGTGVDNVCGSPGCVPRGGCPVRPECGPDVPPDAICHDRMACEAELCDQKWTCNGEPYPGWRGNPAQTDCRGHWKTWCSAPGSTAVAEGDR